MNNLIQATAFAAGVFALAVGAGAPAQSVPATDIRGSVLSYSSVALKMTSRQGILQIELAPSFAGISGGSGGYWEDRGYAW
jgi:hypothetical protein